MCFYISCPQAMAVTASSYESIVNQLVYASTGQLPSAQTLANMENALLAANAPTDLAGLSAACSTNAAVKSIIDSMDSNLLVAYYGGSSASFIGGIYQNVFGRHPSASEVMFWSNAINSGAVTKGQTVLSVLAGASVADMTTFTNTIVTAQTSAIDKAAQEAAEKAAKEAADKAAKEATDKAAKEAEKAAKSSDNTSIVSKVKSFCHNHPVATVVIVTVVIAGIVTAITVPICVHQHNLNKVHNQQRALNNQAYVVRLRQLATPSSTATSGGSSRSSGSSQQL